jgi:hypothetical protein
LSYFTLDDHFSRAPCVTLCIADQVVQSTGATLDPPDPAARCARSWSLAGQRVLDRRSFPASVDHAFVFADCVSVIPSAPLMKAAPTTQRKVQPPHMRDRPNICRLPSEALESPHGHYDVLETRVIVFVPVLVGGACVKFCHDTFPLSGIHSRLGVLVLLYSRCSDTGGKEVFRA